MKKKKSEINKETTNEVEKTEVLFFPDNKTYAGMWFYIITFLAARHGQ